MTKNQLLALLKTLQGNKLPLAICVVAGAVLSMLVFSRIPKRFKVQAIVSIQTQYFQNPLVRDFLPETFDGSELRSQREALIQNAINPEFLASIGKKYSLFPESKGDPIDSYDLEMIDEQFEIIPMGATSFLIGFFDSDPQVAYNVINDTIARIKESLWQERYNTLIRLREGIQQRLEAIAFGQQRGISPILASRPDLLKKEVERLKTGITELTQKYSDRHPKVAAERRRLEELAKLVGTAEGRGRDGDRESGDVRKAITAAAPDFSNVKVDAASKDLYQDLLKKYHYIEVVIYLDEQGQDRYMTVLETPYVPRAAIWPKRPIFLIWGLAAGFLVGALIAFGIGVLQARKSLKKAPV